MASTAALNRAWELQQLPAGLVERAIRPPRLADAATQFAPHRSIFRSLERSNRVRKVFERMDELDQELEQGDPLARHLTHLLDHVSFGLAMTVTEKLINDGPEVMIELLADVLLEPKAVDLFEIAAKEGGLRESVQIDLLHAIKHLREEDFECAAPSLVTGVEGAMRDAAPAGKRRPRNARSAADKAVQQQELRLLFKEIFVTANAVRHGEETDRRRACILLLVALLIWIEASFEGSAMKWLGGRLERHIRSESQPLAA